MKSTIHELKNLISKIMSKKSILILPSIILLFLVNACTPLPTGGPVSANVNYTVHNATYYALPNPLGLRSSEPLDFDFDSDGIIDFSLSSNGIGAISINFNASDIACIARIDASNKTKNFNLAESINNSAIWNANTVYLLSNDNVFGPQVVYEPTPKADGTVILGIRYLKNGDFYFGWIKLYNDKKNQITVIESAFNNIPNQAILAGKK